MNSIAPIIFVINRDEVAAGDATRAKAFLKSLLVSPETARSYFENVDVSFHGYDDDSRELFEIQGVRDFVNKLDTEFPFWLYFMDLSYSGLYAIAMCFLPPFLTTEGQIKEHPRRLAELLEKRWVPAMNHLGKNTGISEVEIDLRTSRCVDYFFKGREKPPQAN